MQLIISDLWEMWKMWENIENSTVFASCCGWIVEKALGPLQPEWV